MRFFTRWLTALRRGYSTRPRFWRNVLFGGGTALLILFWAYVVYLDTVVKTKFEGKRWSLPARVYARPLEIYPGSLLSLKQLTQELNDLGYSEATKPAGSGSFRRDGSTLTVVTRAFTFWDGKEPSVQFRASFDGDTLVDIRNAASDEPLSLVRFDPIQIGSIYPAHHEDRVLIQLADVPPLLIKALLAIEDRHFYEHHGVAPAAILRAFWVNLRAGETVQGGSTITQQLVKNFFLSNERTWARKFNELIMALALEKHYGKDEILEGYLNEIYLGQDGNRAIHGFGLASQFYFGRPLAELKTEHIALLVALVKGPSFYDPRRNKQRAKQRRDLVIDTLLSLDEISKAEADRAKKAPLEISTAGSTGTSSFPAFMDLVRDQLQRDYREEDLTSAGLQIFTTLDAQIQRTADRAIETQVVELEKYKRLPKGRLQGAAIVLNVEGAEVLAVVGGRDPSFAGFNRARDALRQIGSLVKPAVYLTALSDSLNFTPVTMLDDTAFEFKGDDAKTWSPQNFDKEEHGPVPLYQALANSYNISTARLGLAVGIPRVVDTLKALGVTRDLKPYPSLLLGSPALTPLEVAQVFHTLANGGFRAPPRAITSVLTAAGEPVQRYPLSIEKALDPGLVYIVTTMMQNGVRNGTGKSLYSYIPESLAVAGKTGTSNDLRDSWFAGFTRDKLAVVWMGLDDDRPAKLTGAEGALRVFGEIFRSINVQPGSWSVPEGVELVWIDPDTQLRADESCAGAIPLGFVTGTAPTEYSPCTGFRGTVDKTLNWFRRWFQ
jgi:penicillin-binding protein 1B